MDTLANSFADKLAGREPAEYPGRCWPQCAAADYREAPDPRRKFWTRTVCVKCGSFIGYRPAEKKQPATAPTEGAAK